MAKCFDEVSREMNAEFLLTLPTPSQLGDFGLIATLLDALNTPASYSDRDYRYRYANPALTKLCHASAAEMMGKTIAELHNQSVFETFKPALDRVIRGEQVSHEVAIEERTRGLTWWQIEHYPNRDANGQVVGYFTLSRDVTQNKRLEREVAQRESQLRQLVDSIKLPIACWSQDQRLVYCNAPYERWADRSQDQLLGLSLSELFGATAWTLARTSFVRAFAGETSSYERQVKQRDGSLRWHRIQVFPDAAADKLVNRIFTIAFDIEDDIRMRQQLAASEARLRSVVETIKHPILRMGSDRKITYANKSFATYTGRSVDEAVGHTLAELFGEAAAALVETHYARGFAGETVQFEQFAPLADSRRWLRIQIVPDRDAAGTVRGVFATAYDVDAEVRANKRLEEARTRLDRFTDSIPFPLTYLARDATYKFANRAFLERHKLQAQQVIGKHPSEARGQAIWEEYRPYFVGAIAGEETVYEREVSLASGEVRWTRTVYSPDRDESGTVVGVYTASSDIHEIKIAQLEIARVNSRLKALLHQSPVAVIEYDSNWKIAQWSKRAEEMLGSSQAQMIGKHAESGRVHPDDRLEVAEITRKIRAAEVDTVINTNRYKHADGHYVWIQWYTSIAKDAHGRLQSVLSLGVDMTARVDAERRLQRFADRIPNPVTYLGLDSRYQFVNRALEQWTGVSAKDMLGKTPVETRGPALGGYFQSYIDRALNGEELHMERLATLVDGQSRWVRNHFAPDRDENGRIVGCYNVTFDIQEIKLAEQALTRAANCDSLTQTLTRYAFFRELDARLQAADATLLTLMFIDLDGFKKVNDTHGHAAGDALLVDVVSRMRTVLDADDEFARFGGDEFVVLTHCVSRDAAQRLAKKLLAAAEGARLLRAPETAVSASIGVTLRISQHPDPADGETLVREADQAMYIAKRAGGGQIRFFE
jgi:diguanylate cyclase (GGDEF)-like protein/PAS domain S-box-containing protein